MKHFKGGSPTATYNTITKIVTKKFWKPSYVQVNVFVQVKHQKLEKHIVKVKVKVKIIFTPSLNTKLWQSTNVHGLQMPSGWHNLRGSRLVWNFHFLVWDFHFLDVSK